MLLGYDDTKTMLLFFLLGTLDMLETVDMVPKLFKKKSYKEDIINFIYSLQIFTDDLQNEGSTSLYRNIPRKGQILRVQRRFRDGIQA